MQRNDIHYNALQFFEITNLISIKVILTNVRMKFLSNLIFSLKQQSLLLIKSGLGCQCSQARGRVMRCMIPFWIHLLTGIRQIQVLFVWVQFDQKNGSVENSESRATPGGYLQSILHFTKVRKSFRSQGLQGHIWGTIGSRLTPGSCPDRRTPEIPDPEPGNPEKPEKPAPLYFVLLQPNQGTYRHGRGTHGSGLT